MQASYNIFDFGTNPIFTAIIILLAAAHVIALVLSVIVVCLFLWSATRRDRWWTIKTWVVTGIAVAYLGVSFCLMG